MRIRNYALGLLIIFAGVLQASNFVDDNTALPATKTDRFPVTIPTQQWGANDANTTFQALRDIRTVLQRGGVNAKAYGAVGNGSTNDSTAIQAAITAASATVSGGAYGGWVFLPKGVYILGSTLTIPNGVGLRGEGPGTILKASATFNAVNASNVDLIKNANQGGGQEYAFLENLQIDGNKLGGALITGSAVSWGSLFINSYIRDVVIQASSNYGLHVFADQNGITGGGSGPVLFENVWVIRSTNHNVYIEEAATNVEAIAGWTFINLTTEHQGSNASAIYLKGQGTNAGGQINFWNTHCEQGGSETNRTCITIDGWAHAQFIGVQLQAGTPANETAGILITSDYRNLDLQFRSVTNINLINPVLNDQQNGVIFAGVNIPVYNTLDINTPGLSVTPVAGKSIVARDTSAVARSWFDDNGRLTGASLFGAGVDILADTTNNRVIDMIPNVSSGYTSSFGWYFPAASGGVLRERSFTAGIDVRQIGTDGTVFNYENATFQKNLILQRKLISTAGTPPAASSCGTSPTIASGSTDVAGSFTTGSGASACTITFSVAYANTPHCVVVAPSGAALPAFSASTTAMSLTTVAASTAYNYFCVGH